MTIQRVARATTASATASQNHDPKRTASHAASAWRFQNHDHSSSTAASYDGLGHGARRSMTNSAVPPACRDGLGMERTEPLITWAPIAAQLCPLRKRYQALAQTR